MSVFGKDGVITENDPVEQEKRLKYLDLVASAVILQNTVDMTRVIQTLSEERAALFTVRVHVIVRRFQFLYLNAGSVAFIHRL